MSQNKSTPRSAGYGYYLLEENSCTSTDPTRAGSPAYCSRPMNVQSSAGVKESEVDEWVDGVSIAGYCDPASTQPARIPGAAARSPLKRHSLASLTQPQDNSSVQSHTNTGRIPAASQDKQGSLRRRWLRQVLVRRAAAGPQPHPHIQRSPVSAPPRQPRCPGPRAPGRTARGWPRSGSPRGSR